MVRRSHISRQTRRVLTILLEDPHKPWHGYDLCKITELKSGTLYPILMRLKDDGLLTSSWQMPDDNGSRPRHIYQLSAAGIEFATAQQKEPNLVTKLNPSVTT